MNNYYPEKGRYMTDEEQVRYDAYVQKIAKEKRNAHIIGTVLILTQIGVIIYVGLFT